MQLSKAESILLNQNHTATPAWVQKDLNNYSMYLLHKRVLQEEE